MNNFKKELNRKIKKSFKNNYGIENYDEYRFGQYPLESTKEKAKTIFTIKNIKQIVKNFIGYHPEILVHLKNAEVLIAPYQAGLNKIWNNISENDKHLLVLLISYKLLGFRKVKLPRNNDQYWKAIQTAKTLANLKDVYDPRFMHFILEKFDLNPIGYDVKLYFSEIGIAIDYILEQYAYKSNNKIIVAQRDDVVLDIGGCWGDTALYFADKVGEKGKVYSFEFIPNNIKLFNINATDES